MIMIRQDYSRRKGVLTNVSTKMDARDDGHQGILGEADEMVIGVSDIKTVRRRKYKITRDSVMKDMGILCS